MGNVDSTSSTMPEGKTIEKNNTIMFSSRFDDSHQNVWNSVHEMSTNMPKQEHVFTGPSVFH